MRPERISGTYPMVDCRQYHPQRKCAAYCYNDYEHEGAWVVHFGNYIHFQPDFMDKMLQSEARLFVQRSDMPYGIPEVERFHQSIRDWLDKVHAYTEKQAA